jgi:hypothetical protein
VGCTARHTSKINRTSENNNPTINKNGVMSFVFVGAILIYLSLICLSPANTSAQSIGIKINIRRIDIKEFGCAGILPYDGVIYIIIPRRTIEIIPPTISKSCIP